MQPDIVLRMVKLETGVEYHLCVPDVIRNNVPSFAVHASMFKHVEDGEMCI
jgi:hypothetical protein